MRRKIVNIIEYLRSRVRKESAWQYYHGYFKALSDLEQVLKEQENVKDQEDKDASSDAGGED